MAVKLKKGKLDRSKFVTNLVNRDKLTPHLLKASQEEFEWDYHYSPKEKDTAWHPSGNCTPTVSELFAYANTTEAELAEERKRLKSMNPTFQVGHFWHQYLQELVRRLGFANITAIEREGGMHWGDLTPIDPVEIPDGWMIVEGTGDPKPFHWARGFADVAPCVIPKVGEFVVDFKTMGSFDFKQAQVPTRYADKYECQLNIYMDWFDIDRGLIIGIQKDSPHDLKEWEYERNPELAQRIYQKWEAVSMILDAVDAGEYDSEVKLDLELRELDDEFEELPLRGPIEK